MDPRHSQDRHIVRLEWGPVGGESLTTYAAERGESVIAVVLDVLSFTTCVSVACDRGLAVHPYRWRDASASTFAIEHGAELARPRSEAAHSGGVSLSPVSIRTAPDEVRAIVLPSPNGSTISALLAASGATVVAASLRNRSAVGDWIVDRLVAQLPSARGGAPGAPPAIVMVPAGERWPDKSLRPAVEDLWGAGAVIEAIVARLGHQAGPLLLSPESELALHAWRGVSDRIGDALAAAASGRELIEMGWPEDVQVAAELDSSTRVPVLREGIYVAADLLADRGPEG